MIEGYRRVAAATPDIRVADPLYNAQHILALMQKAQREQVQLLVLPELCLTGYTCGDLFLQSTLLQKAAEALTMLVTAGAAEYSGLTIVGLPFVHRGKLYNTAAVFGGGKLLGLVPKSHIPNYGEFYELRHFTPAPIAVEAAQLGTAQVPFGTNLIFADSSDPDFRIAVEICEDLWMPCPPSARHAMAGATVIANLSASDETVGKAAYRRSLAAGQSARLVCGYVYADAGRGESTTDMVFAGHNMICENGAMLAESPSFGDGWAISDMDIQALAFDRLRMNTFAAQPQEYVTVGFTAAENSTDTLCRHIEAHPFIPRDEKERGARCEEILTIQGAGLAKRLQHGGFRSALIGISGGLDSCLALLATVRAFQMLDLPTEQIVAVTMPCFGTTNRTKSNAFALCEALGIACREIDITAAARQHLQDIGHPEDLHNVVYENAQARIRTMVLMDLTVSCNGLVVGTGDLSELALGWATYNGDHMSMYGVNAGIPKTLVRHIVQHAADTCASPALAEVLRDILATPVSPELLPPKDGVISQQTEELVGPYELHDFFLYHMLRWGRSPARIFRLARLAFGDAYTPQVLHQWLVVFCRRFFSQQFKRSCLPDGPKIGSVSLSPRGDWRMPSDASAAVWLAELEAIAL